MPTLWVFGCWCTVLSRPLPLPAFKGHSGSSCQCPKAPQAVQCVTFFRSAAEEPLEDLPDFPFPLEDLLGLPVNFRPKVKELSFAVKVKTSAKSARPWTPSPPSSSINSSSSLSSTRSSTSSYSSPSSIGSRKSSSASSGYWSPSASVKWTLRWKPPPLPLAVEELWEDAEVELDDVDCLKDPLPPPLLPPLEPLEATGVPSRLTTGGAPRNSGYWRSIIDSIKVQTLLGAD